MGLTQTMKFKYEYVACKRVKLDFILFLPKCSSISMFWLFCH